MLLENSHEVATMLFANVLDTKVVNTEREANRTQVVCPITWSDLVLFVTPLVEPFLKLLLGNEAGVREAIHSPHNVHVDTTVIDEFCARM